ncbi:conserved hypothetical protein [Uncinocarpus reesii 1704]|uniref:Uncharacterized protein n=1 Tax=Uncinocarpus reesii (strain UAMH 1704) TaxID=336963 RepID=C4JTB6_UNCRE|nr:uncharacterized protein UREG_05705 [Uncinocarpus reesii 1704]EEP80863.1 conserved hypothetical protein [Uncinocarpus reesii 1704]
MANSPTDPNGEAVRRALEAARNNQDGQIDPRVSAILETAIGELWRKIQSQPDSYILTDNEFALFNYFQDRFRESAVAQRAVARYWNNSLQKFTLIPHAKAARKPGALSFKRLELALMQHFVTPPLHSRRFFVYFNPF